MIAHPFLKFAGSKRQLLPELLARTPGCFGHYFEPFVGGGSMFFALAERVALKNFRGKKRHDACAMEALRGWATLSDLSEELITTYTAIRESPEKLIRVLRLYEKRYRADPETYFYKMRKRSNEKEPIFIAARMIFLNKTCFNGLYRVNSSGKFNVPFGRYKHPTICDEENLRACAAALYGVTLRTVGFSQQLVAAPYHPPKKGDFVYCDPPFVPLSDTANFTSYTKIGFDIQHQEQLAAIARKLAEAGVYVMLSNHDTPVVRKLYKGFTIERVYAIRSINSKTTKRGAVKEVIIRNYT